MRSWIIHNTNITPEEYLRVMGDTECLKQNLIEKTKLSRKQIEEILEQREKKQHDMMHSTSSDITMKHIERFIKLYKDSPLYNTILSYKMNINKAKNSWNYKGTSFSILTETLKNNKSILLNLTFKNDPDIYTTILARFLSNSMIAVGRISNLDGNKFLHSFIVQDNKVYDYSKNMIMNKEDYYKMYQVEIINIVSAKEFLNNRTKYYELKEVLKENPVTLLEFLCWPNEILAGLKKEEIMMHK